MWARRWRTSAAEAAIARATLWEARRGFNWTDPEIWDQIMEQIKQIEDHDTRLRGELARQRREAASGDSKS
jgi:hypothetical protein